MSTTAKMSTTGDMSTTAIHGVDQRSPLVRFEHPALGPTPVEVEQCGAGSAGFVADTSSVLWACAPLLARHLCGAPDLVRGKRCVELGAGIGLVGAVAAALGAARVVLTDVADAQPLLRRNAARAGALEARELLWGDAAHIEACGAAQFDVVLGADILYHQEAADVEKLVQTMSSLLAPGGCVLLAYEFRFDWETTRSFYEICAACGLADEQRALADADEDDQILIVLRRESDGGGGGGAPAAADNT